MNTNAPYAIIIGLDLNGTIISFNEHAAEITGYPSSATLGKNLFEILSFKDRYPYVLRKFEEWQKGDLKLPLSFENVLYTKSGEERFIAWHINEMFNGGSGERNTGGIICCGIDITRLKQYETEISLKKTEEELFKAKKLEAVGILAGGLAHDFNNLLAVILGNITLLKMYRELDAKIIERLSAAENATYKSMDLAKKLVTFSKGGTPMKKMTSIIPLIIDAVSTVFHDSQIKNIHDFADDLAYVEIDEYQMKQVINNLLMNAKEAVMLKDEGEGTVTISAVNFTADQDNKFFLTKGDYIRISIEDTGTGIKERDIPNVFDPCFTTKPLSAEKGCGLGLAVSHSIIEKHKGHLMVNSREGAGSTFHLFLHACARVTRDIQSRDIQSQKKEMHKINSKRRILVLEDEKPVGDVIKIILSRLGYKAELANDGNEVVRLYKNAKKADNPFDAVILDLYIQNGVGGKNTFDALFEYDPHVKAIISSGSPHDPVVADFKAHNFKGALIKPYKVEVLDALLRQVLGIRG
ncbi:MAG: ATP-binding protein [Proteobacteria bacterium]|nr:ATP-binding protein [Pseudomonadota bacterium]